MAAMLCVVCALGTVSAQKKQLDHPDFAIWKSIGNVSITANGQWVGYQLTPGEGDPTTYIYNVSNNTTTTIERARELKFTADGNFAVFKIVPPEDTVKAMKRRKVDEKELPADTLGIMDLANLTITRIPDLNAFKLPERGPSVVAYTVQECSCKEGRRCR